MRPSPLAVQPRVRRGLAAVGLALALTTCAREAAGPSRHAAFSVSPVLPAGLSLAAFNLTVDNVRLIVVRSTPDTVFDQTVAFPANQSTVSLSADVPLQQSPETFQVTTRLLSATTELFTGTRAIAVTADQTTAPTPISLTYSGPGQNVASLTIGPLDSVLTQGATLQFRLKAKDAQGVDVPTFYASWTTSDTNVAKVDPAGVLTAPMSRATVSVVARTPNTQSQPNGVTASTLITFAPVATVLDLAGGCGQSGPLGTQLPQPIVAKVTAGDGGGVPGVVVTFAPPAGGAVATPQVVSDANGLAQTLVTLPSTSGPAAFQVSAPGLTTLPCAQSAFGPAAKLAFVAQPTAGLAGSVIPPVVVAAQDAQGTLVPTFTGNVTVALGANPGNGSLSGTDTVAAVGGLATFSNLSIDKAGVGYTLVAGAAGLTGTTSAAFTIGAGSATQLAFTVQPVTVASGAAITPAVVVSALDALGNVAPTFAAGVTVSIDSGPAGAVLTGTSPVTAVGGVASFADLKLDKVGSYHLRAHATGLTDAISARFDVTIGLSRLLSFTVQPTNVTAGSAIAPAVQVSVKDLQGNTDATFNGNIVVAIATNPGGGTLSGIDTIAATAGVASFSTLSIDKSGIGYTLQATATGVTTGTSTAFTVNPGAAARLAFLVPPTTVGVNAPITPDVVVEIQDTLGNLVTSAANQVDLRIGVNPGNATLGGTTTLNAVNGLATFSDLTLNQPGTGYTLVAGSGSLVAATSTAFDVLPGATQFLVQFNPVTVTAGGSTDLIVTAQDGLGNTVTGYRGTVFFLSSDPLATLPANYTFVAGDNGKHTFTGAVTLKTASSQVVYATDVANSSITGFGIVTVTPGPASKLAYIQQPSDVVQSATMSPAVTVAIEDQFGNVVTSATNTVSLNIAANPSTGVLTGGGAVGPVSGIVTFPRLSIDQAGSGYTLQAISSGLTSVTSASFNVLGAATKQWTGAVSTDWSASGNWTPTGAPTGSDDVLIPSGLTTYPALSASSVVHNLTMLSGTSIETAGFPLDVFGNLDAPSGQITGAGTVLLDGTGATVQGSLPNVQVGGTVRVSGLLSVLGDLDITGTGVVDLGTAQTIVVSGAITTGSSAVLVDTGGSVIAVTGDALFSGGSEAGKLTSGTLQLSGNFTQNGDPESYGAQSGFLTQFVGTGTQVVSFANPGTGAGVSHFGGLQVANTGVGVSLVSPVFADGLLLGVGGGGQQALMLGNGKTLTVQGITLDSLIIDNMPLVVTNSGLGLFAQDVTFRNFSDPSATQLDITRTSGTATFTNLKFLGTPPNPGWQLQVHDPLIGNGAFTVTLVTPTPTKATGARFQATPEAVLVSP